MAATRRTASPAPLSPDEVPKVRDTILEGFERHAAQQARDRRRLRRTLAVAAALHGILFFLQLPLPTRSATVEAEEPRRIYKVEPMPKLKVREIPPEATRPKTPKTPIPVPEILMPEVMEEIELPPVKLEIDLEAPPLDDLPVPAPPPEVVASPREPPPEGPLEVSGAVVPPEPINSPKPGYTEAARRTRLQGTVILRAVIDEEGRVQDLQVLRGLPAGLTQSALATASEWRFEPATLRGKPVPVYWNLSVHFHLQ